MAGNVTIAQVAAQAKVSKSTVSQFLNKRYEYMSESTRQRIEAAIEELNYHPNIIARSLKQKSTYTVGVIVANILHSFSTQILRAIENNFNANGFHTIICNADDEPGKERNYIEMLLAKQVDGIIIFPTGGNLDLYEKMKQRNFPVVFMDRQIDGLEIDTVMLDNHQAAKLAIDAFVENDRRRISIITTSIIRNTSPRIERIEGYKLALAEHGIPVRPEYIRTAEAEQIEDVLKELFALDAPPEAILAGNDIVLLEVLEYMKKHQLKIPEDVAVIGIDEVSFASFYTPPLTVVTQPTIDMANKATELLLEQINSENKITGTAIYRLHPSLIKRSSC